MRKLFQTFGSLNQADRFVLEEIYLPQETHAKHNSSVNKATRQNGRSVSSEAEVYWLIGAEKYLKNWLKIKRKNLSTVLRFFKTSHINTVVKLNKTRVCLLTKQPTQEKRHTQKQFFNWFNNGWLVSDIRQNKRNLTRHNLEGYNIIKRIKTKLVDSLTDANSAYPCSCLSRPF